MKNYLLSLFSIVLLVFGFSLFLKPSSLAIQNTIISKAYAQTCAAPAAATGVTVEFPGCTGSQCNLTQASCKWNSQSEAASYNVTVTQIEGGVIVLNNVSEPSSTTKVVFPITQGKTYKCSVVAVSSCGGLSSASSDQLLCQADALIAPTVIPTVVPTATPIPPTAAPPVPTIPVTGSIMQTIALSGIILATLIGGTVLLFL